MLTSAFSQPHLCHSLNAAAAAAATLLLQPLNTHQRPHCRTLTAGSHWPNALLTQLADM